MTKWIDADGGEISDPSTGAARLMEEIEAMVPEGSAFLTCSLFPDPHLAKPKDWIARRFRLDMVENDCNTYGTVAAFRVTPGQRMSRETSNWAAGLFLMIDDIGTGSGSKFPFSVLEGAPPTALVETSPDNYQAIYLFDSPLGEKWIHQGLIDGFITQKFLGKDSGMSGVNRVARLPFGVNSKAKYRDDRGRKFPVRLARLDLRRRWHPRKLAGAFGISLRPPKAKLTPAESLRKKRTRKAQFREFQFAYVYALMAKAGAIQRGDVDIGAADRLIEAVNQPLFDEVRRLHREAIPLPMGELPEGDWRKALSPDEPENWYRLIINEAFFPVNEIHAVMRDALSNSNSRDFINIECPWSDTHTGGNRTGTSLGLPGAENDDFGSLVCFHGTHDGMTFARKPREESTRRGDNSPGMVDLLKYLGEPPGQGGDAPLAPFQRRMAAYYRAEDELTIALIDEANSGWENYNV